MFMHCMMANSVAFAIMFSTDARVLFAMLCLTILAYLTYLYHGGNCVLTLLEHHFMDDDDVDHYFRAIRHVIPLKNMERHSHQVALIGTGIIMEIVVCALKLTVILASGSFDRLLSGEGCRRYAATG